MYLKGCTRGYQLANPIVPNFRETRTAVVICDGEPTSMIWDVVSETGWSWYPVNALTEEGSDG